MASRCILKPISSFVWMLAGAGFRLGQPGIGSAFEEEVSDGWSILVPAGSWHNVTNIGEEAMQLYAIYAPAHHKPGKIHKTASEAAADGDDDPADWSVQPNVTPEDARS